MKLDLNASKVCLAPKQVLRVHRGARHTVVCHRGQVWLTQHDDARDIVLRAGERFDLDRGGVALLQAFEPSLVSVIPAAPARSARPRRAPAGTVLVSGV